MQEAQSYEIIIKKERQTEFAALLQKHAKNYFRANLGDAKAS